MGGIPGPEIFARPVQPDAAMAFWAARAAMTREQANALADGARWRAFYVTGLARRDMLATVKDAIGAALENGETLADFKGRISTVIERAGWQGDRIDNIFRTNMQTAYSAGRYAKMQAVKAARPYWQYITIEDKRRRPSHAVLHGMVYPADHEFWGANYPPNGFRCRCAVRTLSERQVEDGGLTVQRKMPGDTLYTDPVTGMEYHVQRPGADKGFRENPGKDWLAGMVDATTEKLEQSPPDLAAAMVRRTVQGGFEAWAANPRQDFPLAVLAPADAAALGSRAQVARLSPQTYAKQQKRHPELTAADYALAQDAVQKGTKFRQDVRNMAFALDQPGGVVVIVKATVAGEELYITSLRRMSQKTAERQRTLGKLARRGSKNGADDGA